MDNIKWTKSYFEQFNERAKACNMPTVIIANGYVYKDEIHQLLGIGIELEQEEQES